MDGMKDSVVAEVTVVAGEYPPSREHLENIKQGFLALVAACLAADVRPHQWVPRVSRLGSGQIRIEAVRG